VGELFFNREKPKYCGRPLEMVLTANLQHFNLDAHHNQSTLFFVLSMFASFGYVIAACGSVTPCENAVTITRGCQRASARRRWAVWILDAAAHCNRLSLGVSTTIASNALAAKMYPNAINMDRGMNSVPLSGAEKLKYSSSGFATSSKGHNNVEFQ
ncbi:hypothetical protein B5M09_012102, partial [Aphanomyces astaci]